MGRRGKNPDFTPAPKRRKKVDPRLLMARNHVRALLAQQDVLRDVAMRVPRGAQGEAKFVHAWAVQRGMSGITQALDSDGQIWERHTTASKVDGAWVVQAEWWEPIGMERRLPTVSKAEAP